MEKKKSKMSKRHVEQITALADGIQQSMVKIGINPEDGLEIISEAISLLIIHWSRTREWTPLETASYAGYVMTSFLDKGIGAEIKSIKEYKQQKENLS